MLACTAENSALYDLTATPRNPFDFCAAGTKGASCILAGDVSGGLYLAEPACSGVSYKLTVENRGPSSWTASVLFPGATWDYNYLTIGARSVGTVYATVPSGNSQAVFVVSPASPARQVPTVTLRATVQGLACAQ